MDFRNLFLTPTTYQAILRGLPGSHIVFLDTGCTAVSMSQGGRP